MNYTLAGIRQRRRLPHSDRLRRGGRAASDDHLRERPRGRRLSQRARLQRAGRLRVRRREGARHSQSRTGSSRSSTWSRPTTTSRRATCSRRSTTRSRRSTWRSACSTAATCRSTSAAWPRTCSGRSARSSRRSSRRWREVPEDLQNLDEQLSDTYFCNFSLFQSIPDSWAIKQLFPSMPIHRLNERPTNHAVLGDITCDSDGKIDRFVDRRDVKKTLPLHTMNGDAYYLGVFLVGAYQEILGDLHNLFGDTHAVHVSLDDERRGPARHAHQGRHGARSARLRGVRRRDPAGQAADGRRNRRARRADRLRGRRPAAALLRRRVTRIHVSGRLNHRWLGPLPLLEEAAARALEPLVERARHVGRHRTKPRPLRLRTPHIMFGRAPA